MQSKNVFLKNAMVLTASSLLMRGLGMIFRVYVSNIIGSEGMGLYQLIFSVYLLASTVASAGVTLAVTRMVAECQLNCNRKVMQSLMAKLLCISSVIGIATFAVVYFCAVPIGEIILNDARTINSIKIISVSLPFMSVSAALRGYLMARRKITFSSFAQLAEQIVRFAFCLGFLQFFKVTDIGTSCFIILLSDFIGEISGFLIQVFYYAKDLTTFSTNAKYTKQKKVVKKFFQIFVPVSLVRCVNSSLYTIESVIVPVLMAAYFASKSTSLSQWGLLKGMALPLLMFPSTFIASFILLLVPEISENKANGKTNQNRLIISNSLKFTFATSIGIAGLFYILSNHLGVLFYNDEQIGFFLRILSPVVPFIYIETVSEGLLKGIGEQMSTLWFSIINSVIRIALIYLLVTQKGMQGFLLVMLISNIITSVLHTAKLMHACNTYPKWADWAIKPIIITVISALSANFCLTSFIQQLNNKYLNCILPSIIFLAVFTPLIFITKSVTIKEIKSLVCTKKKVL